MANSETKIDQASTVRWYQLSSAEALARLNTDKNGLSEAEAARRLAEHGPNELAVSGGASPLTLLLRQLESPLIYILLLAAVATLLLDHFVDAAVILAAVVLNTVIGFVQESRAQKALRALSAMVAPQARVVREGRERLVDAREVVPGDIVVLESGAKVPADLRIFRVVELVADESVLTGESLPVSKHPNPIPEEDVPLGDRLNTAFQGTGIVRGRGAGVVVATGNETVLGQISGQMREVGEVRTPLQLQLDRFGNLVAVAVGITALMVVGLGLLAGEDLVDLFLAAIAMAVAAVPEGLPVTITVALAVGAQRMAARNAIIRKLAAVETLGSATVICSDKTGTLTKNEMTVRKVYAGGDLFEVTGAGYSPRGQFLLNGAPIEPNTKPALEMALAVGLLCNDSDVFEVDGRYRADGDPTEAALLVAAAKADLHREVVLAEHPQLDEIPFESDRQYMATLHAEGADRLMLVKGAPERVLDMCDLTYGGDAFDRWQILAKSEEMAAEGLRVLAVGYRLAEAGKDTIDHADVERGLTFVGLQGIIDPPRPEAIEAVANCKLAGVRVNMVTGDHKVTALAIAEQVGIASSADQAIDGRALEAMSDEELYEVVPRVSVYARAAPQHKLRIVRQLKRRGEVVAVTGDGVNDAPALKAADIGVAMGKGGTDAAKEAADMVLTDDNFATIYAAVEEGRVVFDNIRKVILFLIPTGVGLVLVFLASSLMRLPLPFLPAQVIWLNLVTNGLQDVAMAFEGREEDVGRRRPRDPKEGIATPLMIQRTVLVGLVLMVGTLFAFLQELAAGATLEYARTAALTVMVLFQNFHALNSRSFTKSIFQMNPFGNRILFVAVAGAFAIQVLALYWSPLQFVLGTVPLTLDTWLSLLPVGAMVLVVVEIDKAIRRLLRRGQPARV